MLRHAGIFYLALAALVCCGFAPIPREAADALGVTRGKKFEAGFVFVDGKYIAPPYQVERWGTGIRINKIQVTGPLVSWETLLKTQPEENLVREKAEEVEPVDAASSPRQSEKEDSAEGRGGDAASTKDAESVDAASSPRQPEKEDSAEGRGEDAASTKGAEESSKDKEPEVDASAEAMADLFGDEPLKKEEKKDSAAKAESEKKTVDAASAPRQSGKEGVSERRGGGAASTAKKTTAPAKAKPAKPTVTLKGKFVKNATSAKIVKKLNAQRQDIDAQLRRGGFICFGSNYPRTTCDARTGEDTVEKLAALMKKHSDYDDFARAIRKANLDYLSEKLCEDLHRHRIDYIKLQQRMATIKEDRKLQNLLNK